MAPLFRICFCRRHLVLVDSGFTTQQDVCRRTVMYHWRYLPLSLSSASRHSLPLVRSLLSHFCTVSFAKEQISIPYQSCNNNKKQNKNKRRNKQKHSCLFPCEQTVSDTNCGHMVERSDFHYPLELGFWVLLYPLPANGYT